jgi:hypothetical protein
MTLAEIIALGEELEAKGREMPVLDDARAFSEVLTLFYASYGARLLAVARAATSADMARILDVAASTIRYSDHVTDNATGDCVSFCRTCREAESLRVVRAAFDDAPNAGPAPCERCARIDAFAGERCEASGCRPDPCGPVEYHDVEGVPLCAECWQECVDDAAKERP